MITNPSSYKRTTGITTKNYKAASVSLPSQKELYLGGVSPNHTLFNSKVGRPTYLAAFPFSVAASADGFSSSQASIQVTMASASFTK